MLQSLCLLGSLKDESSFFLFHIRFNVNSGRSACEGGAVDFFMLNNISFFIVIILLM